MNNILYLVLKMQEVENKGSVMYYITSTIIFLGTAFITHIWTKKTENYKEIKLAELKDSEKDKHIEALKKDLEKFVELKKLLEEQVERERLLRIEIEKSKRLIQIKLGEITVAFRIIFKQYQQQFKNDPDKLSMLEEFKNILEK